MSILNEFKNPDLVKDAVARVIKMGQILADQLGRRLIFMEVCGTHTMAISRTGLRGLLKDVIELRSGPGCPVCVTAQEDIDKAIEMAKLKGVILATFGDMLRVPGSTSSLEEVKATGADVRIIYSPWEAIHLAQQNSNRQIVLLGVGFETTTPGVAMAIKEAKDKAINNFSVFSLHKTMPQVLNFLLQSDDCSIDGLVLPGHVSAITGCRPFAFIPRAYHLATTVTGFEALDILMSLVNLMEQKISGYPRVANTYGRLVKDAGNELAQQVINEYFEPVHAVWRGMGEVPHSGLKIRQKYQDYDAARRFQVATPPVLHHRGCRCGELLQGKINPHQCPLFAKVCYPSHPVGPCMVSSEGACAAYYHYDEKLGVPHGNP